MSSRSIATIRVEDAPTTALVAAKFNYSAQAAERVVRRFAADEISYLLRTDTPSLIVDEEFYWRVPLVLAFPGIGAAGQAGAIDVNVETGQLSVTPDQVAEIISHAHELAARRVTPSDSPS